MSRIDDVNVKNALSDNVIVPVDLIRIQAFGCSVEGSGNTIITDQATCELPENGGVWVPEKLLTNFDTDLDVDIDGVVTTFTSSRDLQGLPEAEEVLGPEIVSLDLSFSALENNWIEVIQTHDVLYKTVEVWRVLLDPSTYAPKGKAFKWFSGSITKPAIVRALDGEGSYVNLEVSNSFYDYQRTNGIICNVDSHQKYYPGDTGFEFCTEDERKLPWMSGVE